MSSSVTPQGNAVQARTTRRQAWLSDILRSLPGRRSRVLASMSALLVGQGVTAAIQLLALPLFLHFWDAGRYGKWVLLSAVPAYFAMSDGGMIPVAANKISMLHAHGESARANAVFQSAIGLVISAVALVGGAAAGVLALMPDAMLDADSRLALWLLIMATLCTLFGGLFEAGFRAYGNYAQGVLYANAVRVLEFLGLVLGLVVGRTFTAAALGTLLGRAGGTLILGRICRGRFPQLQWGIRHARRAELRELLHPAMAYLAFPLGNALSLQAITLIVGGLFGTVVVAMFNTYRTLSRLVLQATSTLSHAMWAEFSRLYGAGEATALRRFYHRGLLFGAAISLFCSMAMVPTAPWLLAWWTHGKIAFDAPLFLLFVLATLVGSLGHVPRGLLMSTNCHVRLSLMYLVFAAVGVAFTLVAGRLLGPRGAVLASVALEGAMLFLAMRIARGVVAGLAQGSEHAST